MILVPLELILVVLYLVFYVIILWMFAGTYHVDSNPRYRVPDWKWTLNYILVVMMWPVGLPIAFVYDRIRTRRLRDRLAKEEGGYY